MNDFSLFGPNGYSSTRPDNLTVGDEDPAAAEDPVPAASHFLDPMCTVLKVQRTPISN